MSQPREALLARFRAGLVERVRSSQRLLDLFQFGQNPEDLRSLLGELHTLKGESRMLGLTELSELSHALETELAGEPRFSLVLGAFDAMLEALSEGGDSAGLLAALRRLQPTAAEPTPSLPPPPEAVEESAPEPAGLASPPAAAAAPREPEPERGLRQRFVQVDAAQIDLLCERVAELTAAFGRLETDAESSWELDRRRSSNALVIDGFERCRYLLDEATSSAWRLRLVPVEPLLQELARHARAAADRQRKLVTVQVVSGGVQLERDVADQLWDSLLHLVQNAVDHGLEAPDERGDKPPVASLTLRAESVGPTVALRVEDDGKGIDASEVRRVAAERGLVSVDAAMELSDEQACALLFEHGFSTRKETSRTSGRGVGLDVVKRRIESLGGSVALQSHPGIGTRFTLSVPLAITKEKLLVVELSGAPYGFPARVVRAVLSREALPGPGQDSVVRFGGEPLPFRSLSDALGLPAPAVEEELALVLELAGRKHATSVGRVVGERELIRRPAEKLLHGAGIGASAVLEDGRIVLLPDLDFVGRALRAKSGHVVPGVVRPAARRQRVLVADDSPVVRELVSEILTSAGLAVEQASDGSAALQSILESEPDLVVSDVEMPRMNGFDLLAEVRRRSQRLPVVMLSTRGSVEDRKRATRLGANAYLVKTDFHSDGLLEVVRRFVNLGS